MPGPPPEVRQTTRDTVVAKTDPNEALLPASELLLYAGDDGVTRIQARLADGTVWLTQASIAELFQTTPQNITMHLAAIYAERELDEAATCKDYLQVRQEGSREVRRKLKHYALPAIIAVGYRVRSTRGTQFRQWATTRLEEFVVKGFTLDDQRLKNPPGPGQVDYFDELLARIRDIRSSERVFYKKVLEIYATSVDYDARGEASQLFFKRVQNKMHWAAHGHTAAEVIVARADATKAHMGLSSWAGDAPRKTDVSIAKNYLGPDEIEALNRIVNAYLEFAELQALNRKPMHMADWIAKLDDFLRLSDREVLTHPGTVSHDDAVAKAEREYVLFDTQRRVLPTRVETDFDEAMRGVQQLDAARRTTKPRAPTSGKRR